MDAKSIWANRHNKKEEDALKKLRLRDYQNFSTTVIAKVKKVDPDTFIDALFHLALLGVYATCAPETDAETRQVLALYQVEEAIDNPKVNAAKLFNFERVAEEKTIIQ